MANDLHYPRELEDALNDSYFDDSAVSAIKFSIIERKKSSTSKIDRNIVLYMPESLENPTNVSWDSQAFGAGGSNVADGAGIGNVTNDWLAQAKTSGAEWLKTMQGKLSGGSQATGEDIQALATEKIRNPYLKMLFRGVNFRNFEYLFKFTPRSEKDSQEVFEIIQEFRRAALPSTTENGLGGKPDPDAFRLGYPKEVEIEYLYQGESHKWLNKFKRCIITDLNVNYTGAGFYASMRNGFPAQTELRLAFSEIELVYREDIKLKGPSY